MLPYKKLLKQAWQIVKTNRFLWLFGLFLFWGNIFNFIFSQSNDANQPVSPNVQDLTDWFNNHIGIALLLFFVMILFLVIMFVLNYRAKAGLILSVKAIVNKQPTGFKKELIAGKKYFWRLVGISLLLILAMFLLGLVLGGPVILLLNAQLYFRAAILGLFALIILLPLTILLSLMQTTAPLFTVLHDFGIRDSLNASFDLISQAWPVLLFYGFLLFCISIIGFVGSIFSLSILSVPFVILSYFVYYKVGLTLAVLSASVGLIIGIIFFLIVQAILALYVQTAWVLAFLEIVKPIIIKNPDAVVAEPVSEV